MDTSPVRYAISKAPRITRVDVPWTWEEYEEEVEEEEDLPF